MKIPTSVGGAGLSIARLATGGLAQGLPKPSLPRHSSVPGALGGLNSFASTGSGAAKLSAKPSSQPSIKGQLPSSQAERRVGLPGLAAGNLPASWGGGSLAGRLGSLASSPLVSTGLNIAGQASTVGGLVQAQVQQGIFQNESAYLSNMNDAATIQAAIQSQKQQLTSALASEINKGAENIAKAASGQ
jgi:hypothetical protein